MSVLEKEQILGYDALIKRNRIGRTVFYGVSAFAVIAGSGLLVGKIAGDWFNLGGPGFVVGLCIGIAAFFPKLHERMTVKVETQRAFLTLDTLRSFFAHKNVFVLYGAGNHAAYPWEKRLGRNNISLSESTENFSVEVVTKTGIVTIKGSYRIRPRVATESAVAFLGGVAVIAKDVADLIASTITEVLSTKRLDNVSKQLGKLNEELAAKFGTGSTPATPEISHFEERFGIVVGDVTAAEVILSEEAKKTRNAVDEALQFAKGVALILGYSTPAAMQKAQAAGTLSAETIETARKQFLAVSENVDMDIKDWTFNVKGLEGLKDLSPDTVRAISEVARTFRPAPDKSKGK
jgi:hypothetical protein